MKRINIENIDLLIGKNQPGSNSELFEFSIDNMATTDEQYSFSFSYSSNLIHTKYSGYFQLVRQIENYTDERGRDTDVCRLMIEKVSTVRPNTILVPCMDWELNILPTDKNLLSIYQKQMQTLGLDAHNVKENTKWISGHLTPEYNKLFADILSSRIDNGTWDNWVIPNVIFDSHKDEYFVSTI
jgi:hypothetical protein